MADILEILPLSQTALSILSVFLLLIIILRRMDFLYTKDSFPAFRNIMLGIITLSIAYAIKHVGHIFGLAFTESISLGLEIFANLFIIYACLGILKS